MHNATGNIGLVKTIAMKEVINSYAELAKIFVDEISLKAKLKLFYKNDNNIYLHSFIMA